uniref:Wzt_C domain-containing protein n=1 Tax=Rhabditophanes sp. KR3021 TaxID=114890 RepID=A0AC35UFE6_9BILA
MSMDCTSDSDGTSFITSFLNFDLAPTKKYELSLRFISTETDINFVNISYYSLLTQKIERHLHYKIYKNQKNKMFFEYDELIASANNETAKSYFPMKVIAMLCNIKTGSGDSYLVDPINFAKTNYVLRLPKAEVGGYQMLNILATENIETNIDIDIEFSTEIKLHNQVLFKGFLGCKQIKVRIPEELVRLNLPLNHNILF